MESRVSCILYKKLRRERKAKQDLKKVTEKNWKYFQSKKVKEMYSDYP